MLYDVCNKVRVELTIITAFYNFTCYSTGVENWSYKARNGLSLCPIYIISGTFCIPMQSLFSGSGRVVL